MNTYKLQEISYNEGFASAKAKYDRSAEWIPERDGCYHCSRCEEWQDRKTEYCPACGAHMELEKIGKVL